MRHIRRMNEMAEWAHTKETFGVLAGTLMQSVVELWKAHLLTDSYAAHDALNTYYTEMPDYIDALVEDYISMYGKDGLEFINTIRCQEPVAYATALREMLLKYRGCFDDVPTMASGLDDILGEVNSLLYKLKNLS